MKMANTRQIQHQTKNIRGIYEEYLRNDTEVNLNPDYQRDFSWNNEKQNLFIDSIMNNYIVPPIVLLHKKRKLATDYKYDCVDGQHRLKVIKYFIEGRPIPKEDENNHLIYWNKESKKVYYNTIPTAYTNRTIARKFTIEEQDKFYDFLIPIIILKVDEDNIENKTYINDVFLRLQKGERVASYDIYKNYDLPIIKAMNERSLFTLKPYNNTESKYNKLENILDIKKERTSNKKWKKTTFPLKIIKSLLVIHNKSLVIGSYMDGNIGMEIKQQRTYYRISKLSYENTKIYLDKLENFIDELNKNKVENISEYLFNILLFLYISQPSKYNFYMSTANRQKIIKKCSDGKIFEGFKKGDTNKDKKFLDGYDLEKIIGYIDVDIGCNIATVNTPKKNRSVKELKPIELDTDDDENEISGDLIDLAIDTDEDDDKLV